MAIIKPIIKSFNAFLKQLLTDGMLIMMVIAPILAGFFFRFGIPFIDKLISNDSENSLLLLPYYELFDLFLVNLASYMFLFAASVNMLDEYDQNITKQLIVTPIRKKGYLISRLLFPACISVIYSTLILYIFKLSSWTILEIFVFSVLTSALSLVFSLSVFSFSNNKVEGMALAKLCGLFLVGLIIPYFIFDLNQYLFGFLPSFWVAKIKLDFSLISFVGLTVTLVLWFIILYNRFIKKLSS